MMEEMRAITPPSLLGIDRRIPYANKKYHSGWICRGVIIGLAGMKLSGSLKIYGYCKLIIINNRAIIINPNISFIVK